MSEDTNEDLARRIAEVSPLSYEDALEALEANGRTRELAISILESDERYERDLERMHDATRKLRQVWL